MLSPNEVVNAKKAIERLYDRKCTIYENRPYQKPNGMTGEAWEIVEEDIPCRISFSQLSAAEKTDTVSRTHQEIKLLIFPEIAIKAGSRILVKKDSWQDCFVAAGIAAHYDTHQEVPLLAGQRWT